MEKVIGWSRFLIGIVLVAAGLVGILGAADSSFNPISASWVALFAGAYFVLGALKHLKKELSGKRK